jgi:small-conductance mechanosensitive channel
MENFIINHQNELLATLITVVVLLIIKFISNKTVHKIGRISDIVEARTILITKYISASLTFIGLAAMSFIWSVNLKDLGLLFSSVFAVIGVALFAQWSILSNITSGVILFFSFPFKIGDRIKIMDKEILEFEKDNHGIFVIEDIRAFHVHLRNPAGELLTYPNNLMLQKAVSLINDYDDAYEDSDAL